MFYRCSSLYVSDDPVTGTAEIPWRIPSEGTFTSAYPQSEMFYDCAGSRSSTTLYPTVGSYKTYYTKYEPIGYKYNISTTLTNVIGDSSNPTIIRPGIATQLIFTAAEGYLLPYEITVTGATSSWNADTGILTLTNPVDNVSITISGIEKQYNYLCFTAQAADSTIGMSITGTPTVTRAFEYSTDQENWNTFTPGTTTVALANIGDKAYFRGTNASIAEDTSIYYKFAMTG